MDHENLIVYYSHEGNTEELVKGMQVYMKKKPELESYSVSLDAYDNIIIGTPCWFGSYAQAIHTFLSNNKISGKNICLLVCNGGNMRNT